MGVSWTDEQRQAIDNRGGTLLVSAAAGSSAGPRRTAPARRLCLYSACSTA